jgi:hypothetical protein
VDVSRKTAYRFKCTELALSFRRSSGCVCGWTLTTQIESCNLLPVTDALWQWLARQSVEV